jgi:hypothetical protein
MKTHRRSSSGSLETRGVLRGFSITPLWSSRGRAAAAMEGMRRFGAQSLHPKSKLTSLWVELQLQWKSWEDLVPNLYTQKAIDTHKAHSGTIIAFIVSNAFLLCTWPL